MFNGLHFVSFRESRRIDKNIIYIKTNFSGAGGGVNTSFGNQLYLETKLFILFPIERAVWVNSWNLPCKEGNSRFSTVPYKLLLFIEGRELLVLLSKMGFKLTE